MQTGKAEGRRMRPLLGTFVEIGTSNEEHCETAITAAFAAIEMIQARLSFHDRYSDLSRLNRAPGSAVGLNPLSLRVLRLARGMTRASDNLFNCTLGGSLVRQGVLPDHGGMTALECGTADDIEIGAGWARLRRPVRITLDGIAKGFAVDYAVGVLKRHGVHSGWINAGGDLRCFGDSILPVHKREVNGSLTLIGGIQNAALATSAVYSDDTTRFPGRIIRNDSSKPESGAWSVMAHYAWRADALTKVAAIAPEQQRASLIQKLGGRLV
jgi:thiamine biosynthesis lipoprotein